jgi:hypothetical protein
MRKRLTDVNIILLKRSAKRYIVYDSVVPNLGVRVGATGRKTFVVVGRFNGSKHLARHCLGTCGQITTSKHAT